MSHLTSSFIKKKQLSEWFILPTWAKLLITPPPRAIIKRRSEVLILSADSYFSTRESSRNFFRLDAKRFHWPGDIQAGFADQNDLFILRFAESLVLVSKFNFSNDTLVRLDDLTSSYPLAQIHLPSFVPDAKDCNLGTFWHWFVYNFLVQLCDMTVSSQAMFWLDAQTFFFLSRPSNDLSYSWNNSMARRLATSKLHSGDSIKSVQTGTTFVAMSSRAWTTFRTWNTS